jgi:hypothetical protein
VKELLKSLGANAKVIEVDQESMGTHLSPPSSLSIGFEEFVCFCVHAALLTFARSLNPKPYSVQAPGGLCFFFLHESDMRELLWGGNLKRMEVNCKQP